MADRDSERALVPAPSHALSEQDRQKPGATPVQPAHSEATAWGDVLNGLAEGDRRVIRTNADMVLATFSRLENRMVQLDADAIAYLSGYIERHRAVLPLETREALVESLGSFFGEALCGVLGGRWIAGPKGPAVAVGSRLVYPFVEVDRHLAVGPRDRVLHVFRGLCDDCLGPEVEG